MEAEFELKGDTREEAWRSLEQFLKDDSLKIIYNKNKNFADFIKRIGFENEDKWQNFIKENIFSISDLQKKKESNDLLMETQKIKNQKDSIHKHILTLTEQVNTSLYVVFIFGLLAFVVRYIFYGIKWSIKTLKYKE
jgi:hypothetical protein